MLSSDPSSIIITEVYYNEIWTLWTTIGSLVWTSIGSLVWTTFTSIFLYSCMFYVSLFKIEKSKKEKAETRERSSHDDLLVVCKNGVGQR